MADFRLASHGSASLKETMAGAGLATGSGTGGATHFGGSENKLWN
jgi:hypothetical protein